MPNRQNHLSFYKVIEALFNLGLVLVFYISRSDDDKNLMNRPQSLSFYRKGLNQIFYLLTLWKERAMERVVGKVW
jgi:hypothetical protein